MAARRPPQPIRKSVSPAGQRQLRPLARLRKGDVQLLTAEPATASVATSALSAAMQRRSALEEAY